MPPRDPLKGFLGFDPTPAVERELTAPIERVERAAAAAAERELNAMSVAAAAEARAAGQVDLIVHEAGLEVAIAALDRMRRRAMETARASGQRGQAGPWIF